MSREGIAFKIRSLTHLCKRYAVNSDHFQFEKALQPLTFGLLII